VSALGFFGRLAGELVFQTPRTSAPVHFAVSHRHLASEIARSNLNTAIREVLRRPLLGKWRGVLRDAR
jgi:hypothetical protein